MPRFVVRALSLLVLAGGSIATAQAAEDCGWLATSEVDKAFAEFAPWHTMVGGAVGHCTFLSDERAPPNSISFIQQFKSSAAEAGNLYQAMRQNVSGDHVTKDVPGLGERAFRYDAKDAVSQAPGLTSIMAQQGKLIVTISLLLQRPVTAADVQAAVRLGKAALQGADNPDVARQASRCPWLDEPGLNKLFGGKPHQVQVYGENSCMASDQQSRALVVSAIEMQDGFSRDALRSPDCQSRALPELGEDATLSFACKSGNPRASVGFSSKGLAIELTWAPGAEPGEAEKTALIGLAQHARSAQSAR